MNNNNQSETIAGLAEQFGRQIFQVAYRIVGDRHLAEDITQDVFLRLFKKSVDECAQIDNWQAYLKRMAIFASYDVLRKKVRLSEVPYDLNHSSNMQESNHLRPDQNLLFQRDISHFRRALLSLSKTEASAFILRFVEEFTYSEIASQLKLTPSNVGVVINRAKKKLTRLLSQSQFLGESHESVS